MSLFARRPLPIRPSSVRTFTTSLARSSSLQLEKNDADAVADTVPAYPYGRAQWYRQSDRGLYGGQRIQFGNNVGPKFYTKTRRTWHPNAFRKRLFSKSLGRYVQIKVTTRVMRTIDKLGGLDEYLMGEKEARIRELGLSGWWLRWAIMQTPEMRKKFERQRTTLGMPKDSVEEVNEDVSDPAPMEPFVKGATTYRQRRLKFRAGPRTHLYYTTLGWQRATLDQERAFKASIRKFNLEFQEYHDNLTAAAFENLDRIVESEGLDKAATQSVRHRLKLEVEKRAEAVLEELWKQRQGKRAHELFVASRRYRHTRRVTRSKVGLEQRQEKKRLERAAKRKARLARLALE